MNIEKQTQMKALIARGKEQGYLTVAEVSDHFPEMDSEQMDELIGMLQGLGIVVHDEAPDRGQMLLTEPAAAAVDEEDEEIEEAAATLATLDEQFGRTTDPVRMYMREMGSVELLDREGEIRIAKRIEEGLIEAFTAMAMYPEIHRRADRGLRLGPERQETSRRCGRRLLRPQCTAAEGKRDAPGL